MILQSLTHLESYQKHFAKHTTASISCPFGIVQWGKKCLTVEKTQYSWCHHFKLKSLLCFLSNAPVCSCSELGNTSHGRSSCMALRCEIICKHIWWKSLSLFIVITEVIVRTEQQLNRPVTSVQNTNSLFLSVDIYSAIIFPMQFFITKFQQRCRALSEFRIVFQCHLLSYPISHPRSLKNNQDAPTSGAVSFKHSSENGNTVIRIGAYFKSKWKKAMQILRNGYETTTIITPPRGRVEWSTEDASVG